MINFDIIMLSISIGFIVLTIFVMLKTISKLSRALHQTQMLVVGSIVSGIIVEASTPPRIEEKS